jgi:hypothetical protein
MDKVPAPDSTFAVFGEKYEDNLYTANELKWSDEMENRVLTEWNILSKHVDCGYPFMIAARVVRLARRIMHFAVFNCIR